MIQVIKARIQQGHRTMKFPSGPPPALPERFRGLPVIDASKCRADCVQCAGVCPTGAIKGEERRAKREEGEEGQRGNASPSSLISLPSSTLPSPSSVVSVDMGRCLFCGECAAACPQGAIAFTRQHAISARKRAGLITAGEAPLVEALDKRMLKLFGRSLRLREVSAGGCNACEADTNVLGTVGWDLGRFGIQFVASPRHADGLLVTGCVPENMKLALQKTYEAVPGPKIVIAVGACAISGGPYAGHAEVHNGADSTVPVDLYIPGCPPHPLTILDGLLRLLGKLA